jgi:hypothetical protein
MSIDANQLAADDDPFLYVGVQYYLFAGASGLLATWALLLDRFGILSIIPLVLGALGMANYAIPPRLTRMMRQFKRPNYPMPLLVLGSVVALIYLVPTSSRGNAQSIDMGDILLAGSLLTYLSAQYRLFSLGSAAFPPDSRPTPRAETGDEPEKRPESSVGAVELMWLAITLLASLALGVIIWRLTVVDWTIHGPAPADLRPSESSWRLVLLICVAGLETLVLTGLFRALRIYRSSEAEARMALQDALWSETRGEHRRVGRWIAWQNRRLQRRKENQA